MNEILNDADERMEKSLKMLKDQFFNVVLGGVGGALDSIKIEYYGSMTPLQQLALITSPYQGKFVIRPHDPSTMKDIERAIHKANLGANVSGDKNAIHVTSPSPSTDAKKKLADHAAKLANDAKLAVRKIRQDCRTRLKKGNLPEDDEKKADRELQEMTDLFCSEIDGLEKSKVVSILG